MWGSSSRVSDREAWRFSLEYYIEIPGSIGSVTSYVYNYVYLSCFRVYHFAWKLKSNLLLYCLAKNKDGSMEDLTVSPAERQTKIKARLKKFFNRRPTMELLVRKGIWKGNLVLFYFLWTVSQLRDEWAGVGTVARLPRAYSKLKEKIWKVMVEWLSSLRSFNIVNVECSDKKVNSRFRNETDILITLYYHHKNLPRNRKTWWCIRVDFMSEKHILTASLTLLQCKPYYNTQLEKMSGRICLIHQNNRRLELPVNNKLQWFRVLLKRKKINVEYKHCYCVDILWNSWKLCR